jgi:hypothetical protein
MKAIPTSYGGIEYRSRLEARLPLVDNVSVVADSEPGELEKKYRETALALWFLPPDIEPDSPISPWEPGLGRWWQAQKYALVALRRKHDRVGDAALTEQEKRALKFFAQYEAGDKRHFETDTLLASARNVALRALLAEVGAQYPHP